MLIYADGDALARPWTAQPEQAAWVAWFGENAGRVVTSPLGLTELRRATDALGMQVRAAARDLAERVQVIRFSDQSLKSAAMASSVVRPFTAIHVGTAVAHPDVDTVATYDPVLARMAVIHGLDVVSPGRPDGWWDG